MLVKKADDANEWVIERLESQGKTVVIPPRSNRTHPRAYDKDLYKAWYLIENFFAKLKQCKAIATPPTYDKRADNFLGTIYIAASVILLNWGHPLIAFKIFLIKRVDKGCVRIYIGKCARKEATPAKRPEPR